jgi:hypothetical protein
LSQLGHYRYALFIISVAVGGYFFAIVSLAQNWPPASWVQLVYRLTVHDAWNQIPALLEQEELRKGAHANHDRLTDPRKVISVSTEREARDLVRRLKRRIWQNGDLPAGNPDKVDKNFKDPDVHDFPNLKKVDKLTIEQDYGLDTVSYLFYPVRSNGTLFVWHQGTSGFFTTNSAKPIIKALLEKGFIVAAISSITRGANPQPIVDTDHGPLKFDTPGHFYFLKSRGNILRYFYDPVIKTINYAKKFATSTCVMMGGLSGGSQITLGVSAIDRRICLSYSVSGTLPPFLKGKDTFYDPRVTELELETNLLNIYVLAGLGRGRVHYQIANRNDTLTSLNGPGILLYREHVDEAIKNIGIGGRFVGVLDEVANSHEVSKWALDLMIETAQKFEQ